MGTWSNAREIFARSRTLFLYGFSSPPPSHLPAGPMAIPDLASVGSLPQAQYPPPHHLSAGRAFVWMDRYLDRAEWGPRFLQHESIATLVVNSLWRGAELGHYQLGAFAIMANPVQIGRASC